MSFRLEVVEAADRLDTLKHPRAVTVLMLNPRTPKIRVSNRATVLADILNWKSLNEVF